MTSTLARAAHRARTFGADFELTGDTLRSVLDSTPSIEAFFGLGLALGHTRKLLVAISDGLQLTGFKHVV